jgi:hypothetical protein
MPSLVREDRDGPTSGVPVVLPNAAPGSHVGTGEPLKASKWEALPKMSPPRAQALAEGPWKTTTLIGGRWKRSDT